MPHVDALRALAVISVFIYHLAPAALPGGFTGVDIFFVISGFIVSASVIQKKPANFPEFFIGFYARRLLRVMPALLVMLLAVGFMSALLIPDAWLSARHRMTESYAYFGLSNLVLSNTSDNYFSPTAEFNPYTHTWSLAVEEQFYLAFPFLFLFLALYPKKRWISAALFLLGLLASLWIAASWMATDKTTAYYSIFSRFWQLAAGVLLFYAVHRGRFIIQNERTNNVAALVAGWLGFLILGWVFFTAVPNRFPWPGALWTTVGALLLLGGWIHLHPGYRTYSMIANRPVQYTGRISYSLYLWHWPVFVIFRWSVGLDSAWKMAAAAAASVLLAVVSYQWVEKPARKLVHQWRWPLWWLVVGALGVVAASWWVSQQVHAIKPRISLHPTAHRPMDWYPYGEDSHPEVPGCAVKLETQNVLGSVVTVFDSEGTGCAKQPQGPVKTIHAVGDSHNLGYAALYKLTTLFTGWRVLSYDNGGCPMLSLQPQRESSAHCQNSQKNTLAAIGKEFRPGDVIFLPSLRLPRYADQWVRFADARVEEGIFAELSVKARAQAVQDGRALLSSFIQQGVHIIFEAPKPIFKSPTYRCAAAYQYSNPICKDGPDVDRSEQLRLRAPVVAALSDLAASNPEKISVWDPFSVLCPVGAVCSSYQNGKPLFFDADHISAYGSSRVAPSFIAHLQNIKN